MSILLAAAALPLIAVAPDDARFEKKRTFVSEAAKDSLAGASNEDILCLDRRRQGSICLVRSEWSQAVELAKDAPRRGPKPYIPNNNRSYGNSRYGIGSSPSTIRGR